MTNGDTAAASEAAGGADATHQVRAELAAVLTREVRARGMTQTQAAELLGIRQPDVSALVNGRVDGISAERLARLLNALDMEVRIQVGPRPTGAGRAETTVQVVEAF